MIGSLEVLESLLTDIPERSLRALRFFHPGFTALKVFYGCIAILTVAIGALGLVDASRLRQIVESRINIHLLFEIFLFALVIARYLWCVEQSPRVTRIDELSRHLSRIVYVVLYGAICFRQTIAIVRGVSHGSAADFNLFDERFRNGPDSAAFNPRDDFQLLLASGLLALLSVRALAFRLWLRTFSAGNCSPEIKTRAATEGRSASRLES